MGNIVNLHRVRKTRAREEAKENAAANRVKHGRPKAARNAAAAEKVRADHVADAHKIEKE